MATEITDKVIVEEADTDEATMDEAITDEVDTVVGTVVCREVATMDEAGEEITEGSMTRH